MKNNIIKRLKPLCILPSYKYIPSSFQESRYEDTYTRMKENYTELRDNTITQIMDATEYKKILDILKVYTVQITELINTINDLFEKYSSEFNMNKYVTDILGECKTFIDDTIHEAETAEKLKNKQLPLYPDDFKSNKFDKPAKICIPNINGTFSTLDICNSNEDEYLRKLLP